MDKFNLERGSIISTLDKQPEIKIFRTTQKRQVMSQTWLYNTGYTLGVSKHCGNQEDLNHSWMILSFFLCFVCKALSVVFCCAVLSKSNVGDVILFLNKYNLLRNTIVHLQHSMGRKAGCRPAL